MNGKVKELPKGVCSVGICEGVERRERVRKEKELTVGRELSKTGQTGKDSHEFGSKY